MRATNIEMGAMVRVVERRGDKLLITHPGNGREVEAPANLYKWSPRCHAEKEMKELKETRRNRWMKRLAYLAQKRKEEELKEKVRKGEIKAVIWKGGVFPIINGQDLVVRLLDEIRREEKLWLRKKMEEEIVSRCKYWIAGEVCPAIPTTVRKADR